jgi:hypothetical protein
MPPLVLFITSIVQIASTLAAEVISIQRHNSVALPLGCVTWLRYLSQNSIGSLRYPKSTMRTRRKTAAIVTVLPV